MQLRKYKISNVASRTRKSENQRRSGRKFSCSHLIEEWFLYFPLSWCRFVLCESGFWTKCPLQREKKRVKCRAGGHKSVRIFVIARARKREFISVISLCVSPEDWLLYSSKCQITSDYYYSLLRLSVLAKSYRQWRNTHQPSGWTSFWAPVKYEWKQILIFL